MNFFDDAEIKYLRRIILLLLSIVLCYGIYMSNERDAKPADAMISSVKYNELPIYCVNTNQKVVSLTFDAAWGVNDLNDILSVLDKHQAKVTFFVTGDWASKYPDAVIKISEAGHDIGNHGANHKHMTQLNESAMADEIQGCHDTVKAIINKDMFLFRAPYGDYNETVVSVAKKMNYYTLQWDIDSLDWKDYGVASIIDKVCNHKHLGNGSIILLHNGATYTKDALDELLTKLTGQGYTFVAASDLIIKGNYYIDHEGRQFSNKEQ